ncbi:MAG: hypothetical protein ACXIUD_07135 [Mongoliitalea sp.]
MSLWFLLIDISLPILMLFFIVRKGVLSIAYVPFIFFSYNILDKSKFIAIYHFMFLALLLYYVLFNLPFLKKNLFFIVLTVYIFIQIIFEVDLKAFRITIIGLFWAITIIPLAPEICSKFKKEDILNELGKSSMMILTIFILNSILATIFKYYPENQYGFNSGISFGHIGISVYNVLPLAFLFAFRKALLEKKVISLIIIVIALFLTMLTLRRLAMILAILAVVTVFIEVANSKQIKMLFTYGTIFLILSIMILNFSGFTEQFIERVEKRNLADRELGEEKRVFEFGLMYKDLFVYFDYDPWLGYGPFDSWGNYGKGVFGRRPLHSDVTFFVHGFGFFGLFLYLGLVFKVFIYSYFNLRSRGDYLMFSFAIMYFFAFLFSGSNKMPMSPIFLFMIFGILSKKQKTNKEIVINNP